MSLRITTEDGLASTQTSLIDKEIRCIQRVYILNQDDRLFCIEADYRGDKYSHYKYYVRAESAKDAKAFFGNTVTWLKIYSVYELNKVDAELVIFEHNELGKHVVFWRGGASMMVPRYKGE